MVEFSAQDPQRLARWWADVLGWDLDAGTGTTVHPVGPGVELRFVPGGAAGEGQNDVHLDLRSESHDGQNRLVERLFNAGGRFADVGQGDEVPWVVMADVEGNELCVLEPRKVYERTGPVAAVVVHTPDPRAAARSWAEATGMDLVSDRAEFAALCPVSGEGPHLEFLVSGSVTGGRVRVLAP